MASNDLPADPNQRVITNAKQGAEAFGEWWADLSDAERQAFADTHGDRVRERKSRRGLTE